VIERYHDRARQFWGSVMLSRNLYKLRRAADLMGWGAGLAWLKEIEEDLRAVVRPRDMSHRLVTSDRLVKVGLALTQQADKASSLKALKRACLYRDGLMIALLAVCPIRLKNFTALTLGTSLQRVGRRWLIVLNAGDTKTGRPDKRPVPAWLDPNLDRYLDTYRPVLLGCERVVDEPCPNASRTGALWVSSQSGQRLTYSAVGHAILERTRESMGVAVNPHAFRMAAATTAAYRASGEPHLASALLQHTDPRVTEEHYTRASSIDAVLSFAEIVRGLLK
jgi:integrase